MEVSLANLERHSMLFIGSISLTSENPGPVTVDVDSLSKEEAYQVLFNIKRGILSTDSSMDALEKKLSVETTPVQVAPTAVEEINPELKKLLNKRVNTIKKEAKELSVANLRKTLELEKNGKDRKSVVSFLEELYAKHAKEVTEKLKSMQNNSEKEGLDAQTFLDDLPDVVESNEEEIEFTLPDKE